MQVLERHGAQILIDQLILQVLLVKELKGVAAGADQHKKVEQTQVEEEDSVEQHREDAEDEYHFEGPPANPDEPLLYCLVEHLV